MAPAAAWEQGCWDPGAPPGAGPSQALPPAAAPLPPAPLPASPGQAAAPGARPPSPLQRPALPDSTPAPRSCEPCPRHEVQRASPSHAPSLASPLEVKRHYYLAPLKKRQQSQLTTNLTGLLCAASSISAFLKIVLTWGEMILPVLHLRLSFPPTRSSLGLCRIPPLRSVCPHRLNSFPGLCPSPRRLTVTEQTGALKNSQMLGCVPAACGVSAGSVCVHSGARAHRNPREGEAALG